ncbi:MAG: DinB family protein [Chitinophagaceae bacterium]
MTFAESLIAELKHESGLTRKMLERAPFDKREWRPHERSMSLGRLVTHIAEIPHWIPQILENDSFDFAGRPYQPHTASSPEELMEIFRANIDSSVAALEKAAAEDFDKIWVVKRGEQVIYQVLKQVAIRGWAFSHLFHHRGQLSVYLRLLDVPVPGMYGPSADER